MLGTGVNDINGKLNQHCGKHADGTVVALPDSLTQTVNGWWVHSGECVVQLSDQRDRLVQIYVIIEGRHLSELLERQVLFKTEWHRPNDGMTEAVLAQLVTNKMIEVSGLLNQLVPNPKFVKQPWRHLRGHVMLSCVLV